MIWKIRTKVHFFSEYNNKITRIIIDKRMFFGVMMILPLFLKTTP